jgi:hypothetical protein
MVMDVVQWTFWFRGGSNDVGAMLMGCSGSSSYEDC